VTTTPPSLSVHNLREKRDSTKLIWYALVAQRLEQRTWDAGYLSGKAGVVNLSVAIKTEKSALMDFIDQIDPRAV
jgi:hypothetical protein